MQNEGNRRRSDRAADQLHQRAGPRKRVHLGRRVRLVNLAEDKDPGALARDRVDQFDPRQVRVDVSLAVLGRLVVDDRLDVQRSIGTSR